MTQHLNINKTMDRGDLEIPGAVAIIEELNALSRTLKEKGLKISSWYGAFQLSEKDRFLETINRGYHYQKLKNVEDDAHFPWFLYWEITWLLLHMDLQPGQTILDLGGSSSLFSFYLASKGHHVTTVDLNEELVANANFVAQQMNWPLENFAMDMNHLHFDRQFHQITSVCVFEHIPLFERVNINTKIKSLLRDGGRFSITFDYLNPSRLAQINSPTMVHDQFVAPSGLAIRGNSPFCDNGERYLLHPFYSPDGLQEYKKQAVRSGHFDANQLGNIKTDNDYTFGALFLEKK